MPVREEPEVKARVGVGLRLDADCRIAIRDYGTFALALPLCTVILQRLLLIPKMSSREPVRPI